MKPSSLPFFLLHCLLSKNLLYHVDPIIVFLYQGFRLCHLGETRLFAEISFVSKYLVHYTLWNWRCLFTPIHSELQSIWNTFRISDGMSSFRYTALAFQSQFRNHIWCWERSKLPKWNFNNHTDGERKTKISWFLTILMSGAKPEMQKAADTTDMSVLFFQMVLIFGKATHKTMQTLVLAASLGSSVRPNDKITHKISTTARHYQCYQHQCY